MLASSLLTLLICLGSVWGQFIVPEIQIQAIDPEGFRASIKAIRGIKLFQFFGTIRGGQENENKLAVKGTINEKKDGRFTFEDKTFKMKKDDVLEYWVFIQHDGMGYRKDNLLYTVQELVSPNTTFPEFVEIKSGDDKHCEESKTTYRDEYSCIGYLLFEDNFNKKYLNEDFWTIEHRLPQDNQENEFVSYQKNAVKIEDDNLKITPTLLRSDGNKKIKKLDLSNGCTAELQKYCVVEAASQYIVPPVVSGKITTREKFSFKYGRVEIKAKFPQGDWIYPELYLEPAISKYGTTGYESGLIKIAFARGNLELKVGTEDYGNKLLSGGVVLHQFEPCRDKAISHHPDRDDPWGDDYHVYGMTWKEDRIILDVDSTVYGDIKAPTNGFKSLSSQKGCEILNAVYNRWETGTNFAPFDQEFFISIGVGVGGISDFPNNVSKPWNNTDPKAQVNFDRARNDWYNTWKDNKHVLHVDSIKVWAL